jgi:hypothetical protein
MYSLARTWGVRGMRAYAQRNFTAANRDVGRVTKKSDPFDSSGSGIGSVLQRMVTAQ